MRLALRLPRRVVGAVLAAALLAPAPARAWDDIGHMAVAVIAWRHMTPAARARAVALLRAAPPDAGLSQLRPNAGGPEERDFALFARAATWPDLVRDRRNYGRYRIYHHTTWHYADVYWRPGPAGRPEPVAGLQPDAQNAAERVPVLRVLAADPRARAESRAVALAWVLHLVGDLHQPLHTSSRVTPEHPEGDRGGNLVKLGSTSLHSVWDNLFDVARVGVRPDDPGRGRRRSRGRRGGAAEAGGDARLGRAVAVADEVAAAAPMASMLPRVVEGRAGVWVAEGGKLAQTAAYTPDLVDGGAVPPGYRERARRAAAPQLALAGYRLASLLNAALGG
jgi:hypothetical protein